MRNILLAIFLILSCLAFSQDELGFLSIKNFGQDDFNSQVQNFCVSQSESGIIYVGNKEGLLEYRGGIWRKYKLSNFTEVKSIKIANNGIIYVGGVNEFGYFKPEKIKKKDGSTTKRLKYFSLHNKVDTSITNLGDIHSIEAKGDYIYFACSDYLFIWNQKELKTIESKNIIRGLLNFKDEILLKIDFYGLQKIDGQKIKNIRNTEQILYQKETDQIDENGKFKTIKAPAIGLSTKFNEEWNIAYSEHNGFFLYKTENDILVTKAYSFNSINVINKQKPSSLVRLNKNLFAIGFYDIGIYLTNEKGDIIRKIDSKSNLSNNLINSLYFDKQHQLWAAMGKGISRIKLDDNWEKFIPEKSDYSGIIESVKRFNGKLYLASNEGFFVLNNGLETASLAKFSRIKQPLVDMACYNLLNFKTKDIDLLLIITNDGLVALDNKGKLINISPAIAWAMIQDKKDPNRLWVGLDDGLASLYFNGKSFVLEGRVPGIKIQCRQVEQDANGIIWTGSGLSEVAKLSNMVFEKNKITNFDLKIFSSKDGLPKDNAIYPKYIGGHMVFGTGEGIFTINNKNIFVPCSKFGDIFYDKANRKGKQCHRIYEDSANNVWIISKNADETRLQIYKLIPNKLHDKYFIQKPFEANGKGDIFNVMFEDINNILWFGGVSSLYKYIQDFKPANVPKFNSYVYQVIAGEDTIFDGYDFYEGRQYTSQLKGTEEIIEYKNNKLIFDFASLLRNNEETVLYSYMLEGFENVWSAWDIRSQERFTNLPEGSYTFKLRAMDRLGNISDEATFKFIINPPWYRTLWAYIGYFLLFVGFVWGAITVSTRGLKKIIREATAEIQAQKDELEEKNQNILDSIHYAKRIQMAVSPTKEQMNKYFPENFVLWRPRDIVSGDFYWMMHKNNKTVLAAADCTGHGVPGAFMSIMGISFLNQIANMPEVQNAADALNHLRHNVITSLNQEGSKTDTKDGMDISLCVYDFENMLMEFSGAYNPLYMVRNGKIEVIKADRMPVGVHDRMDSPFSNSKFTMMKGDVYYILSDGYIDQFGGAEGKKFMTKRFKDLILEIYNKPMEEQSKILEDTIIAWRGEIEQIDDIIIIGVKIN
ncbi:MAG: hypothetical protein AUJ98_05035 [Bacteroidetes bacterium CG2_30_33_31]|nr:MAG: hypothetical protein AUJ98_05035 [Bacteroidetes bacterium CG2_30_33_31]